MQLIKKHWRAFLPGRSRLTPQQRSQFVFGWLTWLGAESLGVLIAILNLIWMPLVAFLGIAVPEAVLTLPVLATFAVMLLHFMVLYRTRVQAPIFASLGAAISAMALQLTVGRAVADGVIRDRVALRAHGQGRSVALVAAFPALWEGVLGGLLVLGSLTLYLTNEQQVHEISIFSAVLLVQSLPFLAAVGLALIERSPLNAFATWRRLATALDLSAAPAAGTGADRRPAGRRRHRHRALGAISRSTLRRRSALPTTETEERLMAAAAMIGDSSMPKSGIEHAGRDRHAERVVDEGEEQVLLDVAHRGARELDARAPRRGDRP